MRLGIGHGLQGPESSKNRFFLDFRTAARSSGVFSLPSALAIACSTTSRTSQTSATTLATGFGANAARARSVDGSTWELAAENAATNKCINSLTWASGNTGVYTARNTGKSDPSNNSNGVEWVFNASNLHFSDYYQLTDTGWIFSTWYKWVSGASPVTHLRQGSASTACMLVITDVTGNWARYDIGNTGAIGTAQNFEQRASNPTGAPTISTASTIQAYGAQWEVGKYPTSLIVTAGASATRNADVLSFATPSLVAPTGRFDMRLIVAPHYASTEQANDHDLLFFDSNNRLFIQQSTSKLVLRLAGNDVLSSALTWSRNQALTIRAVNKSNGASITVSGATSGSGSASGSAQTAISLPGTAYLLGNASGPQEASGLRAVQFLRP